MSVTVIGPGVVRVDPDVLDADDVLELAGALIEEHGWVTGESGEASCGFSIHGAVGEAAKRATGEAGKDGSASRALRDAAAAKVAAASGKTEMVANDEAADQAAALSIIEEARRTSV